MLSAACSIDPLCCDPGVQTSGLDLTGVLRSIARDRGDQLRDRARFVPGDHYHRELVDVTPDLELWLLAWMPGQISPIHDHGGALTVTTILSGTVFEERFERTCGAAVRPSWTSLRTAGEIDPIDPTEIHRITPIGRVLTLHLYAPTCPDGRIYQSA